jgi:cytoskeleton protein RodZ
MIAPRSSELIAQRLKQARQARRITIEQAATSLRIRLPYVEAMESGNFDAFPSPAQARGFLRSYAESLGLDAAPFLAALGGDASWLEESAAGERDMAAEASDLTGAQLADLDGDAQGEMDATAGVPGDQPQAVASEPDAPRAARPPRTKFGEIGQKLRFQRETLGLSLEEVERHTRLRVFYLKALEAGNLDGLPSPVQGRGMLKNYATFLGMDADALLLQFAEGLQARLAERQGSRLMRLGGRAVDVTPMGSPQPRLITTDLVLAGVLVVFLLAFIVWGGIRISAMRSGQSPTATAPAISDVLAQVSTPTNPYEVALPSTPGGETATPGGEAAGALPTSAPDVPTAPANFSSAAVQVIISVRMRAWMRVTVDDRLAFEGRVMPGSAFPFAGDQRVEILTGNGAGLDVNFNQSDIGLLGTFGQAVQRVFTVQGVQTPTPSITPTPAPATATPALTPTP